MKMYMPESGVCIWQPQRGEAVLSYPHGPLANPKRFRFTTTLTEHLERKRKYWTRQAIAENERPPKPKVEPIFPPEPLPDAA